VIKNDRVFHTVRPSSYVERTWTPGHVDADLESTLEVLATSWVALLVSDQG